MTDQQDENIKKFYQAYGGFGITFEYTIDRFRDIIYYMYIINFDVSKENIEVLLADDSAFAIYNKMKLVLHKSYTDKESIGMLKKVYQYSDKLLSFRNGVIHGNWMAGFTTASSPNIAFGFHHKSSSKKGEVSRDYIITSERLELIIEDLREFNLLLANIRNRICNSTPITLHKEDNFLIKLKVKLEKVELNNLVSGKSK